MEFFNLQGIIYIECLAISSRRCRSTFNKFSTKPREKNVFQIYKCRNSLKVTFPIYLGMFAVQKLLDQSFGSFKTDLEEKVSTCFYAYLGCLTFTKI